MKSNRRILLASSFAVLPATLLVFRLATTFLGSKWGYLLGFGIYWAFALAVTWILASKSKWYLRDILRTHTRTRYRILLSIAALLPIAGVFYISFLPNVRHLSLQTGMLVLVTAILNGLIEEIYWRGLYLKEYGSSFLVGSMLSTILFGAWHFSLWYAKGIEYHGGMLALVGGAFAMGLLWNLVSRRLGDISESALFVKVEFSVHLLRK